MSIQPQPVATVRDELCSALREAEKLLARTFWDDISEAVDKLYTPAHGIVGDPDKTLYDLEWLLVNNQPGFSKAQTMVNHGYTTKDELWRIWCYLMQVRKEMMALGAKPSCIADMIKPTEEVAAWCRT